MKQLHVNDDSFESVVRLFPNYILFFYLPGCPLCKKNERCFNDIELPIISVDIQCCPKVSNKFDIIEVPTIIISKSNKNKLLVGIQSRYELNHALED